MDSVQILLVIYTLSSFVECFVSPISLRGGVVERQTHEFASVETNAAQRRNSLDRIGMALEVKQISSESELREALNIRRKVFVDEQKVPESLEIDEFDQLSSQALHFLTYKGGVPIATARVRFLDSGKRAKIQRVATLAEYRNQGVGRSMMKYIMSFIPSKHLTVQELFLEAQVHAIPFYEKLGFEAFGDEFMDAGIPHRAMQLKVTR
jgi:predicted GNAT family N-acyltransferase